MPPCTGARPRSVGDREAQLRRCIAWHDLRRQAVQLLLAQTAMLRTWVCFDGSIIAADTVVAPGGRAFMFLIRAQNAMLRLSTVMFAGIRQAPEARISGARIGALDGYRVHSALMTISSVRWLARGSNVIHARGRRTIGCRPPYGCPQPRFAAQAAGPRHTTRDRVLGQTTPGKHHCAPERHRRQRAAWSH
jgi:hypothetical protein